MIPKKIHYCWFGQKKQPKLVKRCIESWKSVLSDYEIVCWNEDNLPLNNKFISTAMEKKQYAFVSDVIRLYVVHKYGGIYLDTDVHVIKSFDNLLNYDFFTGEENSNSINFATFGAIENHKLLNFFLNYYESKEFDEFNLPVITSVLSKLYYKSGDQILGSNDRIFPKDYFYPLPYESKYEDYKPYVKKQTYSVHLWNHSWRNEQDYIAEGKYVTGFLKFIENTIYHKKNLYSLHHYLDFLRSCKQHYVRK